MSQTKRHTQPYTYHMAETGCDGEAAVPPPQAYLPPMLTLPPRSSFDNLAISLSPGPMTLVSNFFSDHYPDTDLRSFSQLLIETLPITDAGNLPAPILYQDLTSNCQKELQDDMQKYQQDLDSQPDNSKHESVVRITRPANDGYKWRKYGQKQVKASELPRTYYKCTQTNCPATKNIGHFLGGDISDIIYRGQHNHEPQPDHAQAKYGATIDQHMSFVQKAANPGQQIVNHVVANEVTGDHAANLKKRQTGIGCVDRASSSRVMVAEPKIVLQTRSEVDILDDRFKWCTIPTGKNLIYSLHSWTIISSVKNPYVFTQ
ncbi:putative WRKY transcription factor 58, partial [Bidens hawaiensis]|uniref:putative WRKY transcription factor 58 n=1 Tax=Bidens hawaiensis TaxID=980011 RepID=UPI004049129E